MAYTLDLNGKNALVTGGTRGIGRVISLRLAQAGARVAMLYRSDLSAAESAAAALASVGDRAAEPLIFQADLADEAQTRSSAALALAEFGGKLDILVLNAGLGSGGNLSDVSLADWRAPFETFLFGHVTLLQEVGGAMSGGGSVIVISSGAAHDPLEGLSAYGAGKAALNQMAMVLAQEWGPRGIRVNVVSPGGTAMEPPDYAHLTPRQQETVGATALRRIGTADDVADVVLFFAAELSSFVTGQWVRVNGGRV